MLDVTEANALLDLKGSPTLQCHVGAAPEFEASGYVRLGTATIASVAIWRDGGKVVECTTYVSTGSDWSEWSSGGASYTLPITEYDDIGGVGIEIGKCGDIADFEDRYLVGIAGWASSGVHISLDAMHADPFHSDFSGADVTFFSVPIIGSSPDGQVPEVQATFIRS